MINCQVNDGLQRTFYDAVIQQSSGTSCMEHGGGDGGENKCEQPLLWSEDLRREGLQRKRNQSCSRPQEGFQTVRRGSLLPGENEN